MSDAAAPAIVPASTENEAGNEPASTNENTQAQPKKKPPVFHKFKMGEEEIALTQEEIERDYKKWKGADSKFREANQAKQSVESFMKALQEDPEKVLSDKRLSLDRKKLAEKWLMEQITEELTPVDPRDQKLTEAQRKIKEYEDRDNEVKQTQEEADKAKAIQGRREAISNTLSEAMKLSPLSKHPESAAATLREMAMYMRAAKERGEEVTPQEIVDHIQGNRYQQFYSLANEFEGEDLIEFLGQEVVSRIRKADLARLRASRDEPTRQHRSDPAERTPREQKNSEKVDGYEARRRSNKLLLGA